MGDDPKPDDAVTVEKLRRALAAIDAGQPVAVLIGATALYLSEGRAYSFRKAVRAAILLEIEQ